MIRHRANILPNILIAPVITEKATRLADSDSGRTVTFKVDRRADKGQIKAAIELMFSVKVDNVRVLNVKGKRKGGARRVSGRQPNWRKAYVKLAPGQDISLGEQA